MRRLRWILFKLRVLLRRRARERDLDAEIQFHLDEETEDAAAAGLSAPEARRQAQRSLGNVALAREDTRRVWTWLTIDCLVQDLRYAVRVLRRQPVFTATALLSLALGIGANAAVFSLLKAIQLNSLAVDRPDQLVQVSREQGVESTYPTYEGLRRASRTLSGVIGSSVVPNLDLEEGGERYQAFIEFVTDNYFDVLGVSARRGRVFHEPPTGSSREAAAVISDAYWRAHFAGDPSALGARFRFPITGLDFTVVGIAPPQFRGAHFDMPADVWVSIATALPDVDDRRLRMMGRLRPGETIVRAEAEATAILGRPMRVVSGARGYSTLRNSLTRPLLLLELVVGLVLVITCANLANLVLARGAARDRELAVRRAVGASRGRIVRQLLTESVVLASAGGALGLAVAYWTSAALLGFLPSNQGQVLLNLQFQPDAGVLGFIALLAFLTSVVCGLVPALRATRTAPVSALRISAGSAERQRSRMSRSLVIGEVAMCALLLVVAGVFLRSLENLLGQDAGYDEQGVLVADVRKPIGHSEARADEMFQALRARLAALPNVQVAAFGHVGQLSGSTFPYPIQLPGHAVGSDERRAHEQRVSPGFLAAMGTRIVAGRDVADTDRLGAPPVALVNEAFVHQFGIEGDPIAQRFTKQGGSRKFETFEIVGVVRNAKWVTLREEPRPIYYIPYQQLPGSPRVRFAIRSRGDLNALAASVRQIARSIDRTLVLSNVVPFREIVHRTLVIERLVTHVSLAFALLGLLIACIGLYGSLAYAVVRRRREIGVRIAVGASRRSVEWMMLRESLALLAIGVVIGLPAALFVTRLVSSMLFDLQPGDPVTIAATLATLTVATLAAAYLPARRAAAIDPIRALRED